MTKSIAIVRFAPKDRNEFFSTLRKNVFAYFEREGITRYANRQMKIKTVVLLSAYLLPFLALLIFSPSIPWIVVAYAVMGFALAGVGMSIMHDANHESYSPNKTVNTWLGYTINLLGGSVFNWKLQHNFLHHTFTNIDSLDEDIADKFLLRFSPHTPLKKVHRYQWIYAFPMYGILTLYWGTVKDFAQFARYIRNGVNKAKSDVNRTVLIKMILLKLIYFFVFLGLPVLCGIPFWSNFLGFMVMHLIGGFMLTVIFQLAHTVEETKHPLPQDGSNVIENDWAIHQLNTTMNFSRNNKLVTWYLGGLNYQVEHHLFPQICHIHYPAISEIVKDTAQAYGVPYLEKETFWQAFKSHFGMLRRLGRE